MKALGNGLSVLAKVLRRLRDQKGTETSGDDYRIVLIGLKTVVVLEASQLEVKGFLDVFFGSCLWE